MSHFFPCHSGVDTELVRLKVVVRRKCGDVRVIRVQILPLGDKSVDAVLQVAFLFCQVVDTNLGDRTIPSENEYV